MAVDQVPVWIVDDQISFRRVVIELLASTTRFVLAGEYENGESAIELINGGRAGLVLIDIHMPGMGGIEAARRIRAAHPDLTVLLMSTYDLEDLPGDAVHCGAAAYLHKEDLSAELLSRLWQSDQAC